LFQFRKSSCRHVFVFFRIFVPLCFFFSLMGKLLFFYKSWFIVWNFFIWQALIRENRACLLPYIPDAIRNCQKFRGIIRNSVSRNSAEFHNVFVSAELRTISGNFLGKYEAISERLQPVNQDCLMKKRGSKISWHCN
jgi:hypothetical protein